MRIKGKITTWNDDRGFGFVTPVEGDGRVFLHISEFASRQRRPAENDMVTYELGKDEKKRTRAVAVRFSVLRSARAVSTGKPPSGNARATFALFFLLFVVTEVLRGKLPVAILVFYSGASVVVLAAYWLDKAAAKHGDWRTQESTLHLLALIGGWPGAALAQKAFRHKSKKQEFQQAFWVTVLVNCCALAWLLTAKGSAVLHSLLAGGPS